MIQRLNKINRATLYLFKSARTYSSQQIENERKGEERRRLRGIFLNEIKRTDLRGDKYGNLIYLSTLFNSYQNYINMDNIRNSSLISHWQSYFSGENYNCINETLSNLHHDENYEQLKESILFNFENYDPKEITFICKTYNAPSLRNEKDDINIKLNQYCQKNIKKFDLNDFYNIGFNLFSTDLSFFHDSAEYVLENIKKDKIISTKLDIDKNEDVFENKMEKYDEESRLWFKSNILRCYEVGRSITSSQAKSTSDYLLNEAQFLTKREQKEYEINTILSVMNRILFLNKITKEKLLKSKLFEPFVNQEYLAKVFNGLDLTYYKEEYFGYLDVIQSFLNQNQLYFLLNYYKVKTK